MDLRWKPIRGVDLAGVPKEFCPPGGLDTFQAIVRMPELGQAISLENAYMMAMDRAGSHLCRPSPETEREFQSILIDWVRWVSAQGYRIVLRHDEYEVEGPVQ